MVDRIDRPEAPPHYQITRAKDAHEDQHQSPNQREEQEKRYQKELTEEAWGKFDSKSITIKPVRVARDQISKCLFRTVVFSRGIGTLQIDIIWKDGRKTFGALVLIKNLEHFIQLKKIAAGKEVPEEYWTDGKIVELGIIQRISTTGGFKLGSESEKEAPVVHIKAASFFESLKIIEKGKPNWLAIALYALAAFIVITIVIMILQK